MVSLNPSADALATPLFLSIDAGVAEYRACLLDARLDVVAVECVDLDADLPEFGTRDGVHTLGDRVTAPAQLRLRALDLLLEKLATHARPAGLLRRVVAVSGAAPVLFLDAHESWASTTLTELATAQPGVLHYLLPAFEPLLASLDHSADRRISDVLSPPLSFAVAAPASAADSSAAPQVRQLEAHFGRRSLATCPAPNPSSAPASTSSPSSSSSSATSYSLAASTRHLSTLSAGRQYFASKTGSSLSSHSPAARLLQLRHHDDTGVSTGEIEVGRRVLERCSTIVTESALLSSVLTGRQVVPLAPIDAADACSTNLFDLVERDWSNEILDFVARGSFDHDVERDEGRQVRIDELRKKLGTVEPDGGRPLGTVSSYLVERFGFSPDTLVVPFTTSDAATFLSFPLRTTSRSSDASTRARRDALISLSTDESDALMIAAPEFAPHPDRQYFIHPARTLNGDGDDDDGENEYVAMLSNRGAGLGRALARDLYCNGSWDVFARLVAIVPHGGTLGLDGKHFSLFFPPGHASFVRGFVRLVGGAKVSEFPDRKSNPRLVVESQSLSLRVRLSQLYASLSDSDSAAGTKSDKVDEPRRCHVDSLGFPKLSHAFLPTRVVLAGSGSKNPAVTSILATVLHAPTYSLSATGMETGSIEGDEFDVRARDDDDNDDDAKVETTSAALGAGYKAAWVYAREMQRRGALEDSVGPFSRFLEAKLEAQSRGGGGGSRPHLARTEPITVDVEKQPESSSSSSLESRRRPVAHNLEHRRSSSSYTLDPATHPQNGQNSHSRNSSIYSSTTSIFSSVPNYSAVETAPKTGGGVRQRGEQQSLVDIARYEREFEIDPAGLKLVAVPNEHEFKYYSSMMSEYVRLECHAAKGLI